jgi:hypothetical protein
VLLRVTNVNVARGARIYNAGGHGDEVTDLPLHPPPPDGVRGVAFDVIIRKPSYCSGSSELEMYHVSP